MTPERMRALISAVAVALVGSVALLAACADENQGPAAPEQPIAFSHSGDLEGGTADDVVVISDNISGDGSEVCNDSRVQDEDVVGDDEGTWFGEKVDPPSDVTNNGFTLDVSDDETHLFWTDDGTNLMQAVLIKAGDSSVIYYYNEGEPDAEPDPVEDFSDTDLEGEDGKEISHYVYCFVEQPAVKGGVKFEDADGNGEIDSQEDSLPGWEIYAFADSGSTSGELDSGDGLVRTETTADGTGRLAKGEYEFVLEPGDYIICEEDRDGWSQSEPSANDICKAGDGLAAGGYAVSLAAAEMDTTNHFGNNQTSIEVTVRNQAGDLVPGREVVAVHSSNGAYREGDFRSADTGDDGVAVIENLESGEYCVRTTPLEAPTSLVPPNDPDQPPAFSDDFGTAVSTASGSEPLTLENFKDGCLADPPLEPGDEVTLDLQSEAGDVNGSFQLLDGDQDTEVSAWMVTDVGSVLSDFGVRGSWLENLPSTLRERVKDGTARIGLFVTAAEDEGTTDFTIAAPGGKTVIESDKVPIGDALQTASASTSGSGEVGTVTTEPLYCRTNEVEESSDDGDEVELKGPYLHGFLADAELGVLEDEFGISYAQSAGEAKLKVRAKAKNTKRLVVDYECDADGTCTILKERGGLAKKLDDVTLGAAGDDRVRWVISGLPDGTTLVQSGVSTSGDQMPNASKDDNDDGLVDAQLPDSCVTEGSTWITGAD